MKKIKSLKQLKEIPFENKWLVSFVIIIVSFLVYFNSLNAPFLLDDIHKIVNNPDIRRLSGIPSKLVYPYREHENFERNDPSRPLTYLTYTLNYSLDKLNPFGYHLFNVVLHSLNAVLVFFLVRMLILSAYRKESLAPAFFTALFFAVHPINTSVVAYVYSRSDILAVFFYILAIMLFLKAAWGRKTLHAPALLFFVLSIFSKQMAVTLPAVIFLIDFIFLSGFKMGEVAKRKNYHLSFWAVLLAYLLFRYLYFGGMGDLEAQTTWDRVAYIIIQPYIMIRYLQLLIFPAGMCIDHFIKARGIFDPGILSSSLAIVIAAVFFYRIYARKTELSKIAVFCAAWFLVTLSPTQSFLPTSSALVENRLYLSGLGFYLGIAVMYFIVFEKSDLFKRIPSKIFIIAAVIHLVLLGAVSYRRNQLYDDPVKLYQDVISKYPANYRALNNLGVLYQDQKDFDKAETQYHKALQINPNHIDSLNNLALIYRERKQYDRAIEEYRKVLNIAPASADTHYRIAIVYSEQKDYAKAIAGYKKAIEIAPGYADAHNNLGMIYKIQKKYDMADEEFNRVLQISPGHVGAKYNLRNLKPSQNNASIEEIQKTLGQNPDNGEARYNLGIYYLKQGENDLAKNEFLKVIEIDPEYFEAYNDLGVAYINLKEYDRAVREIQKSLELNPGYIEAHNNLGNLWATKKEYGKAIPEFKKAIELNPSYPKTYYNLGIAYAQQQEYDNSIREFKKYLDMNPDDIFAADYLAKIYYFKKDYKNSLQLLERILELNPDDPNTKSKINMIRNEISGRK